MRICLSMIVKNESAVIERCLASVKPWIHSWAIADTGSSDGTQEMIRRCMADLPGELIERPWVDFATNRNEALALAARHGDYALVIDADEVLEVEPGFRYPELSAPAYLLQLNFGTTQYRRVAMPRLDGVWQWKGVLHEVLVSPHLAEAQYLPGPSIRVFTDGARSRQSQVEKYARDAEVLRQALLKEPDNSRYAFYYAQSLRDCGRLPEAIAAYEKRATMGRFEEEVYYSKLQVARLKEHVGAPEGEVLLAYLAAFDYRPTRAEPMCEFARYNRLRGRYVVAREAARIAAATPRPNDLLFVDISVYDWRARDEWAVAAYWTGDKALSARLCTELLADPRLPEEQRERMQKNLDFAEGRA